MTESIVVDQVSKRFTMQYTRTIKQMSIAALRGEKLYDTFLAVNDVSFTVEQGESIGLMGLNGSGKSTLLKLISGVMKPDGGKVLTRGRIAGLIAAGVGFHLGMSEAETKRKFDEMVEFADIGKFLDTPVGRYSSGMSARLGFAVAAFVESDIFLVDEALSVGDRPFKRKCMKRMEEIKKEGRTLFYVSHAPGSVRQMCDRALVLVDGKLGFDGAVDEGIHFLKYDDNPMPDQNEDDDLGADI